MNWNTLNARFAERAGARSCSQSLLDLLVPIEDWPRCGCGPGSTTLTRHREGDRVWWWCSVCNLPVRRAGVRIAVPRRYASEETRPANNGPKPDRTATR